MRERGEATPISMMVPWSLFLLPQDLEGERSMLGSASRTFDREERRGGPMVRAAGAVLATLVDNGGGSRVWGSVRKGCSLRLCFCCWGGFGDDEAEASSSEGPSLLMIDIVDFVWSNRRMICMYLSYATAFCLVITKMYVATAPAGRIIGMPVAA